MIDNVAENADRLFFSIAGPVSLSRQVTQVRLLVIVRLINAFHFVMI